MVDWTLVDFDIDAKTIRLSFDGNERFTNPAGFIHGGILVAMLDETMGSTILSTTQATMSGTTISLAVDYVRPARCGRLFGDGQITSLGKAIAFLEAKLSGEDGKIVARATASFKLTPFDPDSIVPS
ncbi:PaaI family thioesterase [Rhabdaerophilum sp.]|uniref:PaaI family thioesterase n=1 Tax=Rhabdaerophilum sp. TaxID=2717341 RepID=UPI0038D360B7